MEWQPSLNAVGTLRAASHSPDVIVGALFFFSMGALMGAAVVWFWDTYF